MISELSVWTRKLLSLIERMDVSDAVLVNGHAALAFTVTVDKQRSILLPGIAYPAQSQADYPLRQRLQVSRMRSKPDFESLNSDILGFQRATSDRRRFNAVRPRVKTLPKNHAAAGIRRRSARIPPSRADAESARGSRPSPGEAPAPCRRGSGSGDRRRPSGAPWPRRRRATG